MLCRTLQLVHGQSKQRQQALCTEQDGDIKTLLQWFKQSVYQFVLRYSRCSCSSDAWPPAPANCDNHRRSSLPCRRTNHKTNNITVGRRHEQLGSTNVNSSQGHRCNHHCHCHYHRRSIASSSSLACLLTFLTIAISTSCPAVDPAGVQMWTVYAEKKTVGREKTEWRSCLLHSDKDNTYTLITTTAGKHRHITDTQLALHD